MAKNFGDFQWSVYGDAVRGISSRFPFDFESIERKAFDALPDWVYRYVSAAAGDGRTQRRKLGQREIGKNDLPAQYMHAQISVDQDKRNRSGEG